MRKTLGLAAVCLVLAGCNSGGNDSGPLAEPESTKLENAYNDCDVKSNRVSLADGNRSILIDGLKEQGFADLACILLGLETPEYIVSAMDGTTAMMGRQHEEDDGVSYDWSYHPDNGIDMTIHED